MCKGTEITRGIQRFLQNDDLWGRFAQNWGYFVDYQWFCIVIGRIFDEKTTVFEGHETVKTGD